MSVSSVACCPIVSHDKHADGTDRQTDRLTPDRYITLNQIYNCSSLSNRHLHLKDICDFNYEFSKTRSKILLAAANDNLTHRRDATTNRMAFLKIARACNKDARIVQC